MFERFTGPARSVVVLAHEEASRLNHHSIGTEHILLGLIREHDEMAGQGMTGLAGQVLERMGISLEAARTKVETIVGRGSTPRAGSLPFSPRAKRVLELSLRESLQLGHNDVGPEHLLLALVRDGEGVAAQILVTLGAELPRVHQEVIQLLSRSPSGSATRVHPPRFATRRETPAVVNAGVEARRLAGAGPVGSQHYLLALVHDDNSLAARALADLGVTPRAIEARLGELSPSGTTDETPEAGAQGLVAAGDVHARARARRITLRVEGRRVIVEVDDPELAASMATAMAGRTVRIIRGTDPEAVGFPGLWSAVSGTVEDLTRRLTKAGPGLALRRAAAPYWRPDALDPSVHAAGYWIVNQPEGRSGYLEIAPGIDREELRRWLRAWLGSHRSGLARPGGMHEETGCCTLWVAVDEAGGAFAVSGYGFGTVGPPGSEPVPVEDLVEAAVEDLSSSI